MLVQMFEINLNSHSQVYGNISSGKLPHGAVVTPQTSLTA